MGRGVPVGGGAQHTLNFSGKEHQCKSVQTGQLTGGGWSQVGLREMYVVHAALCADVKCCKNTVVVLHIVMFIIYEKKISACIDSTDCLSGNLCVLLFYKKFMNVILHTYASTFYA